MGYTNLGIEQNNTQFVFQLERPPSHFGLKGRGALLCEYLYEMAKYMAVSVGDYLAEFARAMQGQMDVAGKIAWQQRGDTHYFCVQADSEESAAAILAQSKRTFVSVALQYAIPGCERELSFSAHLNLSEQNPYLRIP
jgi:hypothetical protein